MSFTCLSNIFNSSRRACFALLAYNNFSSKSKRLFSFSSLRPLIKPNLYVNPQNAPIIAENIFITFKIFLLSFLDFLDIFFFKETLCNSFNKKFSSGVAFSKRILCWSFNKVFSTFDLLVLKVIVSDHFWYKHIRLYPIELPSTVNAVIPKKEFNLSFKVVSLSFFYLSKLVSISSTGFQNRSFIKGIILLNALKPNTNDVILPESPKFSKIA